MEECYWRIFGGFEEMKRVLVINFWPEGGMAHYSEAFISKIKNKYDVTYFCNYKSEIKGVKIVKQDIKLNPIKNKKKILETINKVNPEIIHFTSSHPANLFVYGKLQKYNTVLTIHDVKSHEGEKLFKKIFHKMHLKKVAKNVKNIIVHSEKIKQKLPKYFKSKKIWIMQHSDYSHLADIRVKKNKNEKFIILFFGRILEYKGLKYLIKAFEKLPKEKYKLIIAGKGDINCNIPKNIDVEVMNKFISDEEMKKIFSKSNINVLPYISASQSGIAYLSLAFEKPVIATKVGALPEVINSKNGILINSKSSKEISEAILRISKKSKYDELVKNIKKNKLNNQKDILKVVGKIYGN